MLRLPGKLSPDAFLDRFWHKQPLYIPAGTGRIKPSLTRNELGWLATLDDVESRIVFTERSAGALRYRAESGPFDDAFLAGLPSRDWTLLVHDVEKHLPRMRRLFDFVPFIPDWRLDDLMVSFAAPGGGVGPHIDQYDVFLCQGIGIRDWRVATSQVDEDPSASDELALCRPFEGARYECRHGDILYLPPGVAHWGTARRAAMTYSIGMRAPQWSDLCGELPDSERENPFYTDADLRLEENRPGYISARAVERVLGLLGKDRRAFADAEEALGCFATMTKDWLRPDGAAGEEVKRLLEGLRPGAEIAVHGMARIAWSDRRVFVNGASAPLPGRAARLLEEMCARRRVTGAFGGSREQAECLAWMARAGAFDIPER